MPDYIVTISGNSYNVGIVRLEDDQVEVRLGDRTFTATVECPGRAATKTPKILREKEVPDASASPNRTTAPGELGSRGDVLSPLPGNMLKILVKQGDTVEKGQIVAIMEAMKMENEIESHLAGPVTKIAVSEGDTVLENALIMSIG
jgi:biotin carboxyl carrier protein